MLEEDQEGMLEEDEEGVLMVVVLMGRVSGSWVNRGWWGVPIECVDRVCRDDIERC